MDAYFKPPRIVGDLAYIELSRGKEAVIDLADLPLLGGVSWNAFMTYGVWYARSKMRDERGVQRSVQMHTTIMQPSPGFLIDHRDGDGLNNRRYNLREADYSQNAMNRKRKRVGRFGYRGVGIMASGLYTASLAAYGQVYYQSGFATPEAAYEAYRAMAREHHGEFFRE